jgi:hypothetical protein
MNSPITFDMGDLQQEHALTLTEAQAIRVADAGTYELAAERLKGLRALGRKIEAFFDGTKDNPGPAAQAHALWKKLTGQRGEAIRPIEAECTRLTVEMSRWKAEQDRLAREEAARRSREEQELARSVALEEAATLEAQGMPEEAAAVVEQAIAAPAPVVHIVPAAPKVDGVSHRENWKFEVIDANAIPREYLSIDEKKLGAVVRALKGSTRIAGIRVYPEQTTVVRAS